MAAGACPASGTASIFGQTNVAAGISAADDVARVVNLNACAATVGGTQWAAAVLLKSGTLTAWCVDSAGASKQVSVATDDQAGLNAKVTGGVCSAT